MDKNKMLSLSKDLIDGLDGIFPERWKADLDDDKKDGNLTEFCQTSVSWRTDDDPKNLNKTSKPIFIRITADALEEYDRYDKEQKQKSKTYCREYIKNKYRQFDLEANPKGTGNEIWTITTDIIKLR